MQWKWGRRMAALKGKLLQDQRLISNVKAGAGVIVLAIGVSALGSHAAIVSDQVITPDPSSGISSGSPDGRGLEGQGARGQDEIVAVIPTDVDLWRAHVSQKQAADHPPKLVLVSGVIKSACGNTQAASPTYCARDQKLYIDLGLYNHLAHASGNGFQPEVQSPDREHALQKSSVSTSSQAVRHI